MVHGTEENVKNKERLRGKSDGEPVEKQVDFSHLGLV